VLHSFVSGLHLVFSALGLIEASELATVGALGVTVALVAAAIVLVATAGATLPDAARSLRAHPARAIDVSSPLSQSDPDASGHARPRAPGFAVPAA
jgi:hypothetical protein